jgi:DNA-binding protein YbaB
MFGKVWEMKKMYDKYKTLQKALQNLVIRAKEWKYQSNWEELEWAVVVDITWEMKLRDLHINDESLLNPSKKSELEEIIVKTFGKAQTKAQEVVAEKTKEILGFDPNDMASMMAGGWMPWLS